MRFSKAVNVIFIGILIYLYVNPIDSPRFNDHGNNYCSDININNKGHLSHYLSPFTERMNRSSGVYVLEQGTEAMLSRAWLSEQAQQTIDVQYFIFSTDNIGLIALDYLVRAAERGVKVRVLVDDIMLEATGNELLKLAAHKNFSIKVYNPVANTGKNIVKKLINLTTDFHGFNQRMHNKTFTVDGRVSITGGRNIADEYFGYDHEFNFRDRDVLLLGEAVQNIQVSFDEFWHSELSVPVGSLIKNSQEFDTNYNDLHQYACNPMHFSPVIRKKVIELPNIFNEIQDAK